MRGDRWFVCADEQHAPMLIAGLRQRYPQALIEHDADAGYIRNRLAKEIPGVSSVLVGEGCMTLEPINLAAALVHDGHAQEVVLVMRSASGSLRSRASRAGVDKVMDESEFQGSQNQTYEKRVDEEASLREKLGHVDTRTPVHPITSEQQMTAHAMHNTPTSPLPNTTTVHPTQHVAAEELDEVDGLDEAALAVHPKMPALVKRLGLESKHPLSARPVPPVPQAPVICFASGRGGVGKTSIATVSACLASQWGLSCAFVDLDLSFGNAFSMFGQDSPADLSQISVDKNDFRESCASAARLVKEHVNLWGPCERPEMAEVVVPHVAQLIAEVSSGVDLVICDSSSDWGDELACAAQLADRLILVSDERQRSYASLTRAAALAVRLGVARTRIVRVTNHCEQKSKGDPSFLRAAVGLETARSYEIEEGGDEVRELLSLGHVYQLASSQLPFANSVASFLAHTLQELGKLPDSEAARKALEERKSSRVWSLFGLKKEAV
ncbi:MAG: P-loop NTPase [Atopobiaceae bacterium]|nr:P-loop NTPase [Atopobiaceae bacterium]